MFSLFKKELNTFFGSLIGYITIVVFLLTSGLFLWVFPGNYNIPLNGYSTLSGLFSLAPWLYLFLVPAITMRMFAEEKKQGTLETLLTKPVSDFKIVFTKYLAALLLVVFSLLPTLLYFLSVYLLGNPAGNIDTGGTWGAYIGLFFLAAIYVAIGLFASAITDNQVVSFITAMALSFVFYLGFEFIGSSGMPYFLESIFNWLSINEHYLSISRGVIDLRDIAYFIGMTALFLIFTKLVVRSTLKVTVKSFLKNARLPLLILIMMLVSLNFLFRIDLTADKRYSLSEVSKSVLKELEYDVEIEFYLQGDMEPRLHRLQQAVIEKVVDFNTWSSKHFRMLLFDPYILKNAEERDSLYYGLAQKGIKITNYRKNTEHGVETNLVVPGAVVRYGDKEVAVNFLQNNPAFSGEVNLNHSIENIEYELINALRKLMVTKKPVVAFLEGQGEFNRYDVLDISRALASEFEITRITTNDLQQFTENFKILIIAGPTHAFSEQDKFAIDQFVMQGGRVMWLIDPVQVSLDSLQNGFMTVAFPRDLNLNDQFFRYGIRLNYNLLQDVNCSMLRVNTALKGNPEKYTAEPWYFSPLLTPNDEHEISRNLDNVMAEFVSSIDTLATKNISKAVILSTSPYSRKINAPTEVSLEMINMPPARQLFTEEFIPAGVVLEGIFQSVFNNRIVTGLNLYNKEIKSESVPTKMIVFSDGSLIANSVDYRSGSPSIQPLGKDIVSGYTFANKELIINSVQYLNDSEGIMQLRNRSIKLRLLDKVRLNEELGFWQRLNLLLPVFIIFMFGVIFNVVRKRRYSR
ncbi:MAG: gliding motility-associated ABC transporter substrate-binding protein GldG [Prolixibacteraceae bacterium]|nr:gliding motility-associated ABC transporter substrate-binding protein GldG [Prolixibacteraceae bacterium]MBN2773877.1 gliding motility-associated ABC transporter substrate-binding protein GldG [Prolixibacteraceae bacterium]